MMENTTDRLFWTLSSIIVGALLLTIGVKAFPHAAASMVSPMRGVMSAADKSTSNVDKALHGDSSDNMAWNIDSNPQSQQTADGTDINAKDQAINDQLTKQAQALQTYQQQLKNATDHLNDLNNRLVKVENDKSSDNNNNSAEINQLKQDIVDANNKAQQYQNQVTDATNQIADLKQQVAQSSDAQNKDDSLISDLQNKVDGFSNYQTQIQDLKDDIHNQGATISDLQNQLAQNQNQDNADTTRITDLISKIGSMAVQLQNANSQINQLSSDDQDAKNKINQLVNDDIYKTSAIDENTDLSKLKTAGTYLYNSGWKGQDIYTGKPHIEQLKGAGNLNQLEPLMPGFDAGYATIIVSPQLGTWQTQTIIGANGYIIERSMNRGQDFSSDIDSRCQWHIVSGNQGTTLTFKGDVTGKDLNDIKETGIYAINGTGTINDAPTFAEDQMRLLEVINDQNGYIVQKEVSNENVDQTNGHQVISQRTFANNVWENWIQPNNDNRDYTFTYQNQRVLNDVFYMPDGNYHVHHDTNGAPNGFSGYGILTKTSMGDPNHWPDVYLTLIDANGTTWTDTFGYNQWNGWVKSNHQVLELQDGDNLNNLKDAGDYQSWNKSIKHSPYKGYKGWFQIHVENSGGFVYQTLTDSSGKVWTRTYSGYPAVWNNWTTSDAK